MRRWGMKPDSSTALADGACNCWSVILSLTSLPTNHCILDVFKKFQNVGAADEAYIETLSGSNGPYGYWQTTRGVECLNSDEECHGLLAQEISIDLCMTIKPQSGLSDTHIKNEEQYDTLTLSQVAEISHPIHINHR